TTGEGDPPDNAYGFVRQCLGDASLRLEQLEYGLLALGDRAYGDFCACGHMLDDWLRAAGARPLFGMIEVDASDPGALRHWDGALAGRGADHGVAATPAIDAGGVRHWRLHSRTVLI